MRVAILSETFSKNMGYMENMLPKYLAKSGVEVHVVTSDLTAYYQFKEIAKTYSEFASNRKLVPGSVESYDGYTLHVLQHRRALGYVRLKGLREKLSDIGPDCVYSMAAIGWIALEAGLLKPLMGYKFFTGSHTTASVFPLARRRGKSISVAAVKNFLTRWLSGRLTSLSTEKCYGATEDCSDIAVRFFGVEKGKIETCPLGVDTALFSPAISQQDLNAREQLRSQCGFAETDIVCIYTGRFSEDKNPQLLAEAVAGLTAQGEPFKAIFVGDGPQAESLKRSPGCIVFPFTPVEDLAKYYRAADVGVWPTQESTSMLDAAACGLPIVVNDTIIALERVRGNGLMYRLNDIEDLMRVLVVLKDPVLRKSLGETGSHKMKNEYSWEILAERRRKDFEDSISPFRGAGQ